jgi:hypothetical protein
MPELNFLQQIRNDNYILGYVRALICTRKLARLKMVGESCICMMFSDLVVIVGIEKPGIHFQDQNTEQ